MPKTRKFKDKELKVIDGKRDAWIGGIQVHAGLEKKSLRMVHQNGPSIAMKKMP